MTIAGLRATLGHYLRDEALETVPVWQMIAAGLDELRERGKRVMDGTGRLRLVDSAAAVGGGSLPGQVLPSVAIEIADAGAGADELAARLRSRSRPVIGRIHAGHLRLDMRTVLPRDEGALREALEAL